MKIIGIGVEVDRVLSVDQALDTLYGTLGNYWKRDVYENVTIVLVYKPHLRRFLLQKVMYLKDVRYSCVVVMESLTGFDAEYVAVEVMASYLSVLFQEDKKVKEVMNEVLAGFLSEADEDTAEAVFEAIALWLTADPTVNQEIGKPTISMCEQIDRMLRGSYVPTVVHGLVVV